MKQSPWPVSAEILAGRGTDGTSFAADKPHSTCSPREIREDVLLLSQQLWQNCSPSLNLVRYSLIVIG